MTRKAIPIVAVWLAAVAACQAARAEGLRVTAVRFWSLSGVTRVAIETTGEFEFQADRAHNPERIFFDIPNCRPSFEGKRIYAAAVDDKLVKRVRVAETQPGVTRIVLDLEGPTEFTATQISNPDRLMIELRSGAVPTTPPVISAAPSTVVPGLNPAATPAVAAPVKVDAAVEAPPELPKPAAPLLAGKAARSTADGGKSLIRALGLKVTRVVIDPGHGGHDQGTVGPKGLMEKELVLDIAKRLGKLIEQRLGSEVICTRTDDTFIPLEGRTELANQKRADLFLSIHANSSPVIGIRGVETYYLNLTNARDALDVASRENASSGKTVFELRDLIQKITLHDKAEESKEFAGRVQAAMQAFERRYNPAAKNRGVKKAPFVVLIGASMPSVLAEVGFLSNPREEALLRRPEHRQKLAEALYSGVAKYAESLSHFQIARVRD